MEEKSIFAEFEHLYQESCENKRWQGGQTELDVEVTAKERFKRLTRRWRFLILSFCKILKTIRLDRAAGGNSSPANVHFQTQRGVVTYQLSLEMGKIKKASVPASILIESLVALGLFAMITTLLLGDPAFAQGATADFSKR